MLVTLVVAEKFRLEFLFPKNLKDEYDVHNDWKVLRQPTKN